MWRKFPRAGFNGKDQLNKKRGRGVRINRANEGNLMGTETSNVQDPCGFWERERVGLDGRSKIHNKMLLSSDTPAGITARMERGRNHWTLIWKIHGF